MNAGANLLNWVQDQMIPILGILIILSIALIAWNRNFAKLIGAILFLAICYAIVANPQSLLTLGNQLWGMIRG